MTYRNNRSVIALGLAGAFALTTATASVAAPVLSSTATMKAAVTSDLTQVRWRGRGAAAVGIGLAAGALIGAAAASNSYYNGYYYDPYAYGPAYAYEPAPVYATPYAYAPGPVYTYPARRYYRPNCDVDAYGHPDYENCSVYGP